MRHVITHPTQLTKYSLRPKKVFVLALDFNVYIQIDDDESRHIYKTYLKYCMNPLII
jgi:hypothetical protein